MTWEQNYGCFVKDTMLIRHPKLSTKFAKKYGHEILRLPPYHCELNAIELIWADEKNYVARENKGLTLNQAEELFRKKPRWKIVNNL